MNEQGFLEKSLCDIIVPEASEADLEAALGTANVNGKGEQRSLVPSIVQRHTLFFGNAPWINAVQFKVLLIPDL